MERSTKKREEKAFPSAPMGRVRTQGTSRKEGIFGKGGKPSQFHDLFAVTTAYSYVCRVDETF